MCSSAVNSRGKPAVSPMSGVESRLSTSKKKQKRGEFNLRKPALMKAKAAFMSNKFFSFFSEYRRYSLAQIKRKQM